MWRVWSPILAAGFLTLAGPTRGSAGQPARDPVKDARALAARIDKHALRTVDEGMDFVLSEAVECTQVQRAAKARWLTRSGSAARTSSVGRRVK